MSDQRKKSDSIKFYDNYINYQTKSGINERILSLYKKLKKRGLSSSSNVLEIGCGIGSVTFLISKIVKSGTIEALDISPKSIEYARKKILNKNVIFAAADFLEYETKSKNYDRILLFDVLEHIPLEHHKTLFSKISKLMTEDSEILINIPNPDYTIYDQKHQPELLQEIDHAIYLKDFIENIEETDLEIIHFEKYSIWAENDYNFLIIKKKKDFKEVILSQQRSTFQKVNYRLQKVLDLRFKIKFDFLLFPKFYFLIFLVIFLSPMETVPK